MQIAKITSPENYFCNKILKIDDSIRFVGILCKCGRLKAYRRRKGIVPILSIPETKLVYHEAMLKVKMNRIFDKKLGRTNWTVELRNKVKWITIYLERDTMLLSTEISTNHDSVIQKIQAILSG